MAGSFIADIVFIIAIVVVIRKLEDELSSLGLVTRANSMDACDYFGLNTDEVPLVTSIVNPVFVDDYVVPYFPRQISFLTELVPS